MSPAPSFPYNGRRDVCSLLETLNENIHSLPPIQDMRFISAILNMFMSFAKLQANIRLIKQIDRKSEPVFQLFHLTYFKGSSTTSTKEEVNPILVFTW